MPTVGERLRSIFTRARVQPLEERAAAEVSPAEVSPAGVSPAGVSPAGVSPAGVSPAEVSPAPVAPKDALQDELTALGVTSREPVRNALAAAFSSGVEPARVEPARVEPARVEPARVDKPTQKAAIEKLYADPAFSALYNFAIARVQEVEGAHTEWDKLGQAKNFAAAVQFVMKGQALPGGPAVAGAPLAARFTGNMERRAICHLLLLLMPPEDRSERTLRNDGSRGAPQDLFRPFPDSLLRRADDGFQIRDGDLPSIAPIFSAHLKGDVVDKVFRKGQNGLFLASKKYCPGAFLQDRKDINPSSKSKLEQTGHEGDPIFVKIDDIVEENGRRLAKVRVPAQHKVWLWDNGSCVRGDVVLPEMDTVVDRTGKSSGKPIMIPVQHLADYLLASGDDAPRLNYAREDDRAVALAFSETLKTTWHQDRNGYAKTLFDWLEQADARTPREDVELIREKVREAAFQAVVRYATHPRRTHWKLDVDPKRDDWQKEAFTILTGTGIMQDCGNYYEKDKASTRHVHELAWTAQFLRSGYVGGSLDCLGSSEIFERLAKTFLEPLGIITTTGIAEGHGASVQRCLGQPDDNGVIQAGVPLKVKPNEMISGLELPLSSGRGPAAQYMENWGGYLRIDGPIGKRVSWSA